MRLHSLKGVTRRTVDAPVLIRVGAGPELATTVPVPVGLAGTEPRLQARELVAEAADGCERGGELVTSRTSAPRRTNERTVEVRRLTAIEREAVVLDIRVAPLLGYFARQSAARHRVAVRGRGREGEEAGAQRSQSGGSALVAGAHWQCYVHLFEGPVRECRAGAATDCGGEAVKWKEYKCDCIQPIQELELQKPSRPSPPLTPASV